MLPNKSPLDPGKSPRPLSTLHCKLTPSHPQCVVAAPAVKVCCLTGWSGAAAPFPWGMFREDAPKGGAEVAKPCWLGAYQEERLLQVWPHSRALLIQLPLLPNDFLRVFLAACKLQEKLFSSRAHCGLCSGCWEWGAEGSGGACAALSPRTVSRQLRSTAACCVGAGRDPLSPAELLLTCSCPCAVHSLLWQSFWFRSS